MDIGATEGMVDLKHPTQGRTLRSYEILSLFGLKPSHPIPPYYSAVMWCGDTRVEIVPQGWHPHKKRRVFAVCKKCSTWVCAGHLHQHRKACR